MIISDNLMIDPSLILAKKSYENTILNIKIMFQENKNIEFYMPNTFKKLLLEEPENILSEDNKLYRFYLHGAKPINKIELDNFRSEFIG